MFRMSENSKIGNYTIGPKIKSGAFGIDTILLKHQIKDEIKYYEGRLLKIKEKKPQNSARTILKARQSLFNEMKIMDQLRTDYGFSIREKIIFIKMIRQKMNSSKSSFCLRIFVFF